MSQIIQTSVLEIFQELQIQHCDLLIDFCVQRTHHLITILIGLTFEEIFSMVTYTLDNPTANDKSLNLYYQLNKSIREGNSSVMWQNYMFYLNSCWSKLPSLSNLTVYRAIDIPVDVKCEYMDGNKISWKSFTSTSIDKEAVEKFLGAPKKGTIFEIEVKDGRRIKDFSVYNDEEEVLLPPNSRFEVKSSRVDGDLTTIYLLQI
eukprot:TRINITY_DN13620_c0_g1_i1.p1 TRINITY_DN13620_c0_g1~~TRINITY_DN13620_c0_g1_i1.p1  ORF type:complete len:204 (+),score=37.19 TRINITY_DN13620_c0_g1_i1:129-740(+)